MIGLPISALCLCLHVCLCCIAPVNYFVTCLLLRGAIKIKFLILNSRKVAMWALNSFLFISFVIWPRSDISWVQMWRGEANLSLCNWNTPMETSVRSTAVNYFWQQQLPLLQFVILFATFTLFVRCKTAAKMSDLVCISELRNLE